MPTLMPSGLTMVAVTKVRTMTAVGQNTQRAIPVRETVEGTGGLLLSVLMLRPYPSAEWTGKPTVPPCGPVRAARFVRDCGFR
ncbi:hypothetical protein QFZ52_001735 [Arthrobacter woluwensis]|nr:hypothetical protein [Arthrobacter woluwensis]